MLLNENGTVLERQFLLRGLFVEILVAAPLPLGRGPWPLGRVRRRCGIPDPKSGSGQSSNVRHAAQVPLYCEPSARTRGRQALFR